MSKRIIVFCVIVVICFRINGQSTDNNYKRVKINLIGRSIKELADAGIETDHGLFVKNRYFTSDFSQNELDIIKKLGYEYEVIVSDVHRYYADPTRTSENTRSQLQWRNNCFAPPISEYNYKTPVNYKPGNMGGYFTLAEMNQILDSMAQKYPKLITKRQAIHDIKSHDGNHIYVVKVSDNASLDETNEPKILYTALHHAREPNSMSQMIFFLWYILENYESDPMVKIIVDNTQMFFIPCVNPDGYELNRKNYPQGGGLWRKNAWKDTTGSVVGVDLNRNYGHTWGKDNNGSSPNPSSLLYRGTSPFSEPETQAVRALCLEHDFKIAINYHTFGNYLIYPGSDLSTDNQFESHFKKIGNVINSENNFALGTDQQTVGYSVNGDSDNWMFGEKGEKNPILAYTPEVGSSFWPPFVDIEYLNKSCIWMNMAAALITLNYYEAEEITTGNYLDQTNHNMQIKVSRIGMTSGHTTISLKSQTHHVNVINPERYFSLESGQDTILIFNTEISNNQRFDDGISFELKVANDGIEKTSIIKKNWAESPFVSIFSDQENEPNNYLWNGWTTTEEVYKSPPYAITDSKLGLYPTNFRASITLKNPIDLSNVTHAILQFDAKWEIEDNYDYVQVSASRDNKDFIPLCGLYTNPGSKDQTFLSPVYDGVQSDWIKEEIDLSSFAGTPKLWLRFSIVTDAYEQRDGFYFDNLEVKVATKPSSLDETALMSIQVVPNIIFPGQSITTYGLESNAKYDLKIMNMQGKMLYSYPIIDKQAIVLPDMASGLYIFDFSRDAGVSLVRKKVLVIR